MKIKIYLLSFIFFLTINISAQKAGVPGSRTYDDYKTPQFCGTSCHIDIYQQWQQAMMSQAFTHHWDEIEYFELAIPHAEIDPAVAEVKEGCNGCHAPISFLAGDLPPQKPEFNTRANESVSCDLCHTVSGFEGDTPFNFNFVSEPSDGKTKLVPAEQEILPNIKLLNLIFWPHQNSAEHVIMKNHPTVYGLNQLTLNGKKDLIQKKV
jgi:hypothetical protein